MAQLKQSISSRSASFTYARRALSALVVAIVLAPCRQLPDTRCVTPVYARCQALTEKPCSVWHLGRGGQRLDIQLWLRRNRQRRFGLPHGVIPHPLQRRLAPPALPALGRRRVLQHNAGRFSQIWYFRVILFGTLPFAKRHNLPPLFHQRQHPNVHLLDTAYPHPAQADSATPARPSGDNAPVHSALRAFRIVRR